MEAAAPSTPTPDIGVPQPLGSSGTKLALSTAGNARMTNADSAAILISTSTAVTLADLDVPMASSQVTSSASRKAIRLKLPCAVVPSGRVIVSYGPAVSANG